jgi:hypothetical protein
MIRLVTETLCGCSPTRSRRCLRLTLTLKSGCHIDDLAHETAERLRRAIAINLVIAWRIMLMTLLGRETPELPAEILFSDVEMRTLHAYAKKKD